MPNPNDTNVTKLCNQGHPDQDGIVPWWKL